MSHPSPTALLSPTALESAAQDVGAAISHPVAPPSRDRAHRLHVRLRLGARRDRGLGEVLLLIGVAAVAGPPVVAVAGVVVLLALAAAGPFLLLPILLIALAFLAFIAIGAAG